MSVTSLNKMVYKVYIDNYGIYSNNIKEGISYDYIETDGTLTNLGNCVCSEAGSSMCWHDGPSWWEKITFENTSQDRYNIYNGGSGSGERLPLALHASTSS